MILNSNYVVKKLIVKLLVKQCASNVCKIAQMSSSSCKVFWFTLHKNIAFKKNIMAENKIKHKNKKNKKEKGKK